MQIKVYRKSGRPIDPADDAAYMDDWRNFYDKACERAKADNLKLERFLSYGESALQKKHYKETIISNFEELTKVYLETGFPVLFGYSRDEQLIAVIQDI